MTRARAQGGFTLIEIMVSMALLVIGLLGVIALHATTVKGNRLSRELERARVYATQIMEELRDKDVTTLGTDVNLANVTASDGIVYHRRYTVAGSGLVLITVTVTFSDSDDSSDTHTAKLQMLRTTLEKM